MIEDEDEEEDYWNSLPSGDSVCPICGAPTINCTVADNACTKCDYYETYYTGTAYN